MGVLNSVWNFLMFWTVIDRKYRKIRDDETKRDVSITLGVTSIFQTLLTAVLTVALIWGAIALYGALDGDAALLFIFIIVGMIACAIGALVAFIQGVIGGLLYMIYQFKLNKRPIRWIALAVWLAIIVGMIVVVVLVVIPNI